MPPIHNAAKAGDVARVKSSLDTGTNVNAKDHVRALRDTRARAAAHGLPPPGPLCGPSARRGAAGSPFRARRAAPLPLPLRARRGALAGAARPRGCAHAARRPPAHPAAP
jgi:hypothetical protein